MVLARLGVGKLDRWRGLFEITLVTVDQVICWQNSPFGSKNEDFYDWKILWVKLEAIKSTAEMQITSLNQGPKWLCGSQLLMWMALSGELGARTDWNPVAACIQPERLNGRAAALWNSSTFNSSEGQLLIERIRSWQRSTPKCIMDKGEMVLWLSELGKHWVIA